MKKHYAYLHTIDGEPATCAREQIVIVSGDRVLQLAGSVQQIRREQAASIRWRKANGFPAARVRYGYRKVEVPSHERDKGKKSNR